MIIGILVIFTCGYCRVLLALQCTNWLQQTVEDGDDFYPYKHDACYVCRCDKGLITMCKSVSCAPPHCPHWKWIAGKCCQFECFGSFAGNVVNSTSIPKPANDITGSQADNVMPDLGLRLVASTVTTFLILALLLFLIHRFRQRCLLMELRRFGQRRVRQDDLDHMDYSPEFIAIHCPPLYIDPPPPYSSLKPAPGEVPPPYDAIDSNNQAIHSNNQAINSNNQAINSNNQVINSNGDSRNSSMESVGNNMLSCVCSLSRNSIGGSQGSTISDDILVFRMSDDSSRNLNNISTNITCFSSRQNSANGRRSNSVAHQIHEVNLSGREPLLKECGTTNRNISSVHAGINSSGRQHITMGVLNQNRNKQNQSSDGFLLMRNLQTRNSVSNATNAVNLELRNTVLNFHNRNCSHQMNTSPYNNIKANLTPTITDISESTALGESLLSSQESPFYENETCRKTENVTSVSDDTDSTVKFDQQIQLFAKNKRYPTTVLQSFTNSQVLSAAIGPNIKQSISSCSFPGKADVQNLQNSASSLSDKTLAGLPLSRSKSDHLKANGSLINQPYKCVLKSSTCFTSSANHTPRGFYKEPGVIKYLNLQQSKEQENDCRNAKLVLPNIEDTPADFNVRDCSNVDHKNLELQTNIIDSGEIVGRRQDELRNLRMSHKFNKKYLNIGMEGLNNSSLCFASDHHLQNSLSENAQFLRASAFSDTVEKCTVPAVGTDAQYPDISSKQILQLCVLNKQCSNSEVSSLPLNDKELKTQLVNGQLFQCEENSDNQKSSNSNLLSTSNNASTKVLSQASTKVSMAQSWHGGQTRFCDANAPIIYANTLVRNVNCKIDKKSCLDKDMSNVFYPFSKPLNTDVVLDRNVVPSSEKRACASQLYNYSTKENALIKDKKRHLFNRHSAICFPTKHDASVLCHTTSRLFHSRHESHSGKRIPEHSNKRFLSCYSESLKKSGHRNGFNSESIVTDLNLSTLVNTHDSSDNNVNNHNEHLVNKYINTRHTNALDKKENKRCESTRGELITADRNVSLSISSEVYQSRKKISNSGTSVLSNYHFNEELKQNSASPMLKVQKQSNCVHKQCQVTIV